MKSIFTKISLFLEMIKIEHSVFALPFAYAGLLMAGGKWPGAFIFFWVTVAMISFRTMAMSLNRLFDRSIDAMNPRTENRALPRRRLSLFWAWFFTVVAFLIFEWSAFQLGGLCLGLSPIPVALALIYPLMKRFTWASHFALGFILGIAPYGAWIAVSGEFAWAPFFLTLGVMTWVAGFDMIYALQDIDFDKAHGLFSFPAKFGRHQTLRVTQVLHGITVLSWAAAGWGSGSGIIYYAGLCVIAYSLVREHRLVRGFGTVKINEAFFAMNAVVSLVFFLATLLDVVI